MRVDAPARFQVQVIGPMGCYSLRFEPDADGLEGRIEVEIEGERRSWPVEMIELRKNGQLVLSGMTDGIEMGGDRSWFELVAEPAPPRVTYWGSKVVRRVDEGLVEL